MIVAGIFHGSHNPFSFTNYVSNITDTLCIISNKVKEFSCHGTAPSIMIKGSSI